MQDITSIASVLAALLLAAIGAQAQNTPAKPVSCVNATSMAFNATRFAGRWFEVAVNPAPPSPKACVQVDLQLSVGGANQTLTIEVTYADSKQFLNRQQTMKANVTAANITAASAAGHTFSYPPGASSLPARTYKLLATDYENYAFVCGYANASSNATEYGIVMTRERVPNATVLAAANSSNFLNGTMTPIIQSADCFRSGAASPILPFTSVLLTAMYAVLTLIQV